MKKIVLLLTTLVILAGSSRAQQADVKLRGTRLTYPLVRKWIAEFNKEYAGIRVSITPTAPPDSIDFTIASYQLNEAELLGKQAIIVTRYVQLPIVNARRTDLGKWQRQGISERNFNALFFPAAEPVMPWASAQPVIYVRDRPTCAVKAFATHYGKNPKNIRGTGVTGDDEDLAQAVKTDINGIAFNNLGFIYDPATRQVRDSLAIIPLDLNENGVVDNNEQIYGSLDEVINFIETTSNVKFVNERVNFVFREGKKDQSAGLFLQWVLTKGQQFNHQFGFLNLDGKLLGDQLSIISSAYGLSSVPACDGAEKLKRDQKAINH